MRAPPTDWQVGPRNRWAYVHVDEVVPTVPVPRRDGPASALPRNLSDVEIDLPYLDGLAVVHRGELVVERYGGEMTERSQHLSQSVGKSVAGLLAQILVGDGRLDPATLVTEHVPEVARSGYAGATVQHLLDMTAAIDFVEDYAADFWRYDVACGWHPPVTGADAHTILDFLPTVGPAPWRHGERFHYATPNTDLLGLVLERAGGRPLAQLLGDELWGPLGAEADALLAVDHAGTASIGGGFCATLRDFARIGLHVARGGGAGLGANAIVDPTDPDAPSGATAYGNQWWRRDGRPLARGIHGQLITADDETVVVILSSWPDATDAALEARHRSLAAELITRRRPPAGW